MNKAQEDIRMSKHVLQIKVSCHLPYALNKLRDIEKFWKFNSGTRFFTAICFYRFSKVVYHLKPKKHIDWTNLSSKYTLPIFFRAPRACLTKPPKNYTIKL